MTFSEKKHATEKIHERARQLRGSFLNSVALVEREAALILTEYFCSDDQAKQRLFFESVVTSHFFSLKSKKDILWKILKVDYPRFFKTNDQVLKSFDDIMQFRNKLAHSVVDVSDEALVRPIEKGVGFVDWEKGAPITDAEFNEWEVKVSMLHSCLNDLKRLLPCKELP